MDNQTETKINDYEIELIHDLIADAKSTAQKKTLIYGGIGIVISMIPTGLLPSRRRVSDNPTDNLIQSMGFGPFLIVFCIIFTIVPLTILIDKRYFNLKKDLLEQIKVKLSGRVIKKQSEENNDFYTMTIKSYIGKEIKIFLSQDQYEHYEIGNSCEIEVLKYSKYHL